MSISITICQKVVGVALRLMEMLGSETPTLTSRTGSADYSTWSLMFVPGHPSLPQANNAGQILGKSNEHRNEKRASHTLRQRHPRKQLLQLAKLVYQHGRRLQNNQHREPRYPNLLLGPKLRHNTNPHRRRHEPRLWYLFQQNILPILEQNGPRTPRLRELGIKLQHFTK